MVHFSTILLGAAAILSQRGLALPVPDSSSYDSNYSSSSPPSNDSNYNSGSSYSNDNSGSYNSGGDYNSDGDYNSGGSYNYGDTTTSDNKYQATSTYTPTYTTSTIKYGSGYNNWNSGYSDCVSQCMATYAAPPSMYTPPPPPPPSQENNYGGSDNSSDITIVVAPHQGILRFVPFAVNATVGQTIHFVWGAGPHTVTKSSILTPCNKTENSTDFFSSGSQNASFTFDITVNSTTDPIVYYCGIPGHCPKGMFGFINAPNAGGSGTTVADMMPAMIANNSDFAMQAMYTANKTSGTSAENWGDSLDMSQVPPSMQQEYMQNVLMTRLLFAANPGMLEAGKGAANADGSAIAVPSEITQLTSGAASDGTANAGDAPSSSASTAPTSTDSSAPSATSAGAAATTTASKSGAMSRSVASVGAIGAISVVVALLGL